MFKVISSLLYTNEGCLHVCFDSRNNKADMELSVLINISACRERKQLSHEVILVIPWTQTDFGAMFKIIQFYKHYEGVNKVQL